MTRADEIRTRAEKATPGPWKITWPSEEVEDADGRLVAADARQNSDNTEFIAHAREDIPWLLAERDRLTKNLDTLFEGGNR